MMTQPPHILIVDDHRDIRDALVKYLEKNGMRATSAIYRPMISSRIPS